MADNTPKELTIEQMDALRKQEGAPIPVVSDAAPKELTIEQMDALRNGGQTVPTDNPSFYDKVTRSNITPPDYIKNINNPVLRHAANFASEFGGTAAAIPGGLVNLILHPYNTIQAPANALNELAASESETHPALSYLHAGEAAIPLLGPALHNTEMQIRNGNFSGAAGGILPQLLAPEIAKEAGVGDFAAKSLKPASRGAGAILSHPLTPHVAGAIGGGLIGHGLGFSGLLPSLVEMVGGGGIGGGLLKNAFGSLGERLGRAGDLPAYLKTIENENTDLRPGDAGYYEQEARVNAAKGIDIKRKQQYQESVNEIYGDQNLSEYQRTKALNKLNESYKQPQNDYGGYKRAAKDIRYMGNQELPYLVSTPARTQMQDTLGDYNNLLKPNPSWQDILPTNGIHH